MNRLIPLSSCVIALAAILSIPTTAFAQDEAPDRPRTGKFELNTHAAIEVPIAGAVGRAEVEGNGVGIARRGGVVLKTRTMTGDAEAVSLNIRWDNPMARDGNTFTGNGVAIVRIGDRALRYRVTVRGRVERTDNGAVMLGRFRGDGPGELQLVGGFRGPLVQPDSDDDESDDDV